MLKNNIRMSKPFSNKFRKSIPIAMRAECLINVLSEVFTVATSYEGTHDKLITTQLEASNAKMRLRASQKFTTLKGKMSHQKPLNYVNK